MTILQRTVCDVLDGRLSLDKLTRVDARQVLRELQAGRCKGNPHRLLARRLKRMAHGWSPVAMKYTLENRGDLL
jgi:hypothetical protein